MVSLLFLFVFSFFQTEGIGGGGWLGLVGGGGGWLGSWRPKKICVGGLSHAIKSGIVTGHRQQLPKPSAIKTT